MAEHIRMADLNGSGKSWSVLDALNDALNDVRTGETAADCIAIITLSTQDGAYDTRFWQAGMRRSEFVALLEIAKQRAIRSMEE